MLIRNFSTKHALFFAVAAVAAAPLIVACGSKDTPPATNPNVAGGQCPPNAAPGYPGCPPAGGPTYAPTGPAPTYAPTGPATAPPPPTGPATAPPPPTGPATAPPPPISGDPTDLAIKAAATQWAPGMQAEGARANVQVVEGKDSSISVTMQGGKCYSVVAVGATGGVMGVEVQVMLPLVTTPAASDVSAMGVAVAGKGANAICPLTPLPIPYTVRVIARKGSGTVGVQVYSKIK